MSAVVTAPECPCGGTVELRDGKAVGYRAPYHAKPIWLCLACGARVGCHPGSTAPLGTPASRELRALRVEAHALFDPIWESGRVTRHVAYAWLAHLMGEWDVEGVHISQLDERRLRWMIRLLHAKWAAAAQAAPAALPPAPRGEGH